MLISSVWRAWARVYFMMGLLLGGLFVGGVLATVNAILFAWWVPPSAKWGVLITSLSLALLIDLGVLKISLPQNARQVPEKVQLRGPKYGALQFGFEMGTGLRTFMTSALPHAVAFCALLVLPTSLALVAGLGFGAGRTIVPLARAVPGNEPDWTFTFDAAASRVRTMLGLSIFLAALVLI